MDRSPHIHVVPEAAVKGSKAYKAIKDQGAPMFQDLARGYKHRITRAGEFVVFEVAQGGVLRVGRVEEPGAGEVALALFGRELRGRVVVVG